MGDTRATGRGDQLRPSQTSGGAVARQRRAPEGGAGAQPGPMAEKGGPKRNSGSSGPKMQRAVPLY